ncbi:hypothetical protein [Paenibacillus sp. OSY-SE]|uniref:hypothetical protein n=1 Tax=Paenibacillus sp. OSY-SE TaxID=1196323 RepID=UPI0003719FEF|nr:hypothetical protein [Paenibacillus sp. OSY-SE]
MQGELKRGFRNNKKAAFIIVLLFLHEDKTCKEFLNSVFMPSSNLYKFEDNMRINPIRTPGVVALTSITEPISLDQFFHLWLFAKASASTVKPPIRMDTCWGT